MIILVLISLASLVEAKDAVIAYRSAVAGTMCSAVGNASFCPRLRFWNSSGSGTWGSEIELPSLGDDIEYMMIRSSPTMNKLIIISQGADRNLDSYICTGNCTLASSWNQSRHIGSVADISGTRRYDFQFESSSGDAILVYSVNSTNASRDLAYKVISSATTNLSTLTEQYIDDTFNGGNVDFSWVDMDRKKINTSKEIALIAMDDNNATSYAWIWNGSSWGNEALVASDMSSASGNEAIGVVYSYNTSRAMLIAGNGSTGNFSSRIWNGSAWSALSETDTNPGSTRDVRWITLKADPNSDYLQAMFIDGTQRDLHTAFWNGSAWNVTSDITTGVGNSGSNRGADFDWNSNSTGLLAWGESPSTINYMQCTPRCNGTINTDSNFSSNTRYIVLGRNPTQNDTVKILGVRIDNTGNGALGSFGWNDSITSNYGDSVITSSTGSQNVYIAFALETPAYFDNTPPTVTLVSPANGSSVVSPANFTFRATDDTSAQLVCSIFIDSVLNRTNSSTENGTNTSFIIGGLSSGPHTWYVSCNDSINNTGVSAIWNVNISSPPVVTMYSPLNATYNVTTLPLNYTAVDTDLASCWYSLDGAATIPLPGCINSTLSGLSYGPHNVTVFANDSAGNNASNTSYFYIDICPVITVPGSYQMMLDYFGAPNDGSDFIGSSKVCVKLASSDVIFDCNGHSITNNNTGGTTFGVLLNGSHTNVTLKNCPSISRYEYGVVYFRSNYSSILNSTSWNNTYSGFWMRESPYINLTGNSAHSSKFGDGFTVQLNSYGNTLVNNTAYSNAVHGFDLNSADSNNLQNNTAYGNFQGGISIFNSDKNMISDCRLYNNGKDLLVNITGSSRTINVTNLVFDNPSGVFHKNFTTISMNDSISTGSAYSLNWSALPAALPGNHLSFDQKFVDIAFLTGTVSLDSIVLLWTDAEVSGGGYDDSLFELWNYSSGWVEAPASLDPSGNTLSMLSLARAGIYGILQFNDSTPPVVALNSPANNTLTNVSSINFNFIATDETSPTMNCSLYLDGVLNRTNSSTANNTLTVLQINGIGQGAHSWNVTCKDGNNNIGASNTWFFTVDLTPPTVAIQSPANSTYNLM